MQFFVLSLAMSKKKGLVDQGMSAHMPTVEDGLSSHMKRSREMSIQSLLVKYEWNSTWQEKQGLSPDDTEKCVCVLCTLWSYTLQRPAFHSAAIGWHTVFHKWAPVLAGKWQATRLCKDLGTVKFQAPAGLWQPRPKPEDAPAKLLDFFFFFFLPATHSVSNSRPGPFKRVMQGRLQRLVCVFSYNSSHREGQEGLVQTWRLLLFRSFSFLFFDSSLSCLFSL